MELPVLTEPEKYLESLDFELLSFRIAGDMNVVGLEIHRYFPMRHYRYL